MLPPVQEMDEAWRGATLWDGRQLGYVPHEPLRIAPDLPLFTKSEAPDPVTYQVLRWKLWSINLEHSDTIKRVSGSPAIVYMDDFATSILTARGENLVCGPTIQYFTGLADLIVKWTLEHRHPDPGIEDRDIFLQNDPYIGAAHQIDTSLYMPVFFEGALFCWLFNSAHQGDLGGSSPGSFCVGAKDIFDEPTPVPPIKLMRAGKLQSDVVEMFTRKSRTPQMVALQLRSQVAGLEAARSRILALLERYGPAIVNGAMERMISDCADAVARRLAALPDGIFDEVTYISGLTPTDSKAHRYRLAIRKQGGLLHCSNEGTDPQFGSANCTYSAWRSAILCATSSMLASDHMSCPAGVLRALRFEPVPGTLSCAAYPAAVTTIVSTTVSITLASQVLSRILLLGPAEIAETALAAGAASVASTWVLTGLDQHGRRVADVTGEGIAGGTGATRHRDGIDNGGAWFMPGNVSGDVEEWEQVLPMLYLYRREHRDSGGAGRMRGGNGVAAAITGHKTEDAEVVTVNVDTAVNATPGLAGGLPGHSGDLRYLGSAGIAEALAGGWAPADRVAVEARLGPADRLRPKSTCRMLPSDLMMFQVCGSGGFGDPLNRDPAAVAADVRAGSVSAEAAHNLYGVVIESDQADPEATRQRRAALREARLGAAEPPVSKGSSDAAAGAPRRQASDSLWIAGSGADALWVCGDCGHGLGPVTENYKLAAATLRSDPSAVQSGIYPDPARFCDDRFELRQALCPNCAAVLATEFCRTDEPVRFDLRLDEATLGKRP